jgi:hypothetical protein
LGPRCTDRVAYRHFERTQIPKVNLRLDAASPRRSEIEIDFECKNHIVRVSIPNSGFEMRLKGH